MVPKSNATHFHWLLLHIYANACMRPYPSPILIVYICLIVMDTCEGLSVLWKSNDQKVLFWTKVTNANILVKSTTCFRSCGLLIQISVSRNLSQSHFSVLRQASQFHMQLAWESEHNMITWKHHSGACCTTHSPLSVRASCVPSHREMQHVSRDMARWCRPLHKKRASAIQRYYTHSIARFFVFFWFVFAQRGRRH